MRKTWKRALSLVLSAAVALTGGVITPNAKKAVAADKLFTAELACNGGVWNFGASPVTGSVVTVDVTAGGDYTLKAKADRDFTVPSGAMWVSTELTAIPTDYSVVGKTVKIAGKEYDWSKATLYSDEGNIRLGIWNQWNSNEVANTIPTADGIDVKAGDEFEFTFTVKEPEKLFTAELACNGGVWDFGASPVSDSVVTVNVAAAGDYTLKTAADRDFTIPSGAMWVSTELAAVPTDFSVVGKTVKIAGKEYDWSKATLYSDEGNIRLGIWNQWNSNEVANTIPTADGIDVKKGDAFEFTFTVKTSGGTVTPPGGTTPQPDTKKTLGLAKGKTFTSGNFKYKVTKAATITTVTKKTTKGTVSVVGLSAAGKKKSSISVGKTAKKSGATYSVASVGSKAFKKATKLKKATLGTNIKSIPTSAFDGCKKLTTVTAKGVTKIGKSAFKGCKALKKLVLKKKLSSVKKGAFKGCKKKIAVSGGSKKVKKANVKKLKKSGYKKFK